VPFTIIAGVSHSQIGQNGCLTGQYANNEGRVRLVRPEETVAAGTPRHWLEKP
jgi:hypothetical protein